jgi:hypothetical protein
MFVQFSQCIEIISPFTAAKVQKAKCHVSGVLAKSNPMPNDFIAKPEGELGTLTAGIIST